MEYPGTIVSIAETSPEAQPGAFVAPAGRFAGCWEFQYTLDRAWSARRTLCPGVGYAQNVDGAETSHNRRLVIADLLRWRRASLPAR
jgi:hypothetical protein